MEEIVLLRFACFGVTVPVTNCHSVVSVLAGMCWDSVVHSHFLLQSKYRGGGPYDCSP